MRARLEYPTSIRLTANDKRRLRKHAERWQLSLAGLIQMVLMQWLEVQDTKAAKNENRADNHDDQRADGPLPVPEA